MSRCSGAVSRSGSMAARKYAPGNPVLRNVIALASNDWRGHLDDLSPNALDNCEHATKRLCLHLHETRRGAALMLQQESFYELKSKGIAQPSREVGCTKEPRVVAIILAIPVARRHFDMVSNVRHIEALPWFR